MEFLVNYSVADIARVYYYLGNINKISLHEVKEEDFKSILSNLEALLHLKDESTD